MLVVWIRGMRENEGVAYLLNLYGTVFNVYKCLAFTPPPKLVPMVRISSGAST